MKYLKLFEEIDFSKKSLRKEEDIEEGLKSSILTGAIALASLLPHNVNGQFFKSKSNTNTEVATKTNIPRSGETVLVKMDEHQLKEFENSLNKNGFNISMGNLKLSKNFEMDIFKGKEFRFIITSSMSKNDAGGDMQNQQQIKQFINDKYPSLETRLMRGSTYHNNGQSITIRMVANADMSIEND